MSNTNPFAAALGSAQGNKSSKSFTETLGEQGLGNFDAQNMNERVFENTPFGSDGGFKQPGDMGFPSLDTNRQQQELIKKQEYDRKRLELHRKVNPVDQKDVFSARQEATKKKIDDLRKQLRNLAKEIKKFHKEIDITLMGRVTDVGFDGIGDENFFDKLRAFIILLTQRVRSAQTWAKQMNAKAKKKAKRGKGLGKKMAESSGFEQRATMEEFYNNERGDNWGE
jgi:hypothetical protein